MKQMNRLATGVGMMLCLALSAGVASAVNPPHAPDDHFLCYRMSPGNFGPLTVNLVDQFETGGFSVRSLGEVCAPANKNGEGVVDSVTHLVAYNIKPVSVTATPGAPPRSGIRVVNQLMDFHVDIIRADRLLVPSNKS